MWPLRTEGPALTLRASFLLSPHLWPLPSPAQAAEFSSICLFSQPSALGTPPETQLSSQVLPQQGLASSAPHTHSRSNLRLKLSSPGRGKGSRLPGEGGDRQRQMGSPEKGPGLKMDREVFVAGPSGSCPSAGVRAGVCAGQGYREGRVGQKVAPRLVSGCPRTSPPPQLGVGPQQPQATCLSVHSWHIPCSHTRLWVPFWGYGQEGVWATSQAGPRQFGKARTYLEAWLRTQWGRTE